MASKASPVVAFGVVLAAVNIAAAQITLTKIADTSTSIPGGTESFAWFGPAVDGGYSPSISGGTVAFFGQGASGRNGIYAASGGSLSVVADTDTPIPGGTGNFAYFRYSPSADGDNVAFIGLDASYRTGIYVGSAGSVQLVADANTPVPGGTETFAGFADELSADGGKVAFYGESSGGPVGFCESDGGVLRIVVDGNTPVPGGIGTFRFPYGYRSITLGGGNSVFTGWWDSLESGTYAEIDGTLTLIADTLTPVPGGTGTFYAFDMVETTPPTIDGENVAFWAAESSWPWAGGIYLYSGESLSVVANDSTPVPGGGGNFTSFGPRPPAIDGLNVLFHGTHASGSGLYVSVGGSIMTVVEVGQTLDGKTVEYVETGSESFDGDQVVFWVYFSGGSQAIYAASIPVPYYALDLEIINGEWGDVVVEPDAPSYAVGTPVTLTAEPIPGKAFKHWMVLDPNHPGDANYLVIDGNDTTTIVMNADRQVTAVFKCGAGSLMLPMLMVGMALWAMRGRRRGRS